MSTGIFFIVVWFGAVLILCLGATAVTLYEGVKRRQFERRYLERFGPNLVVWPKRKRIGVPHRWQ